MMGESRVRQAVSDNTTLTAEMTLGHERRVNCWAIPPEKEKKCTQPLKVENAALSPRLQHYVAGEWPDEPRSERYAALSV